jgi:dTMP kinase
LYDIEQQRRVVKWEGNLLLENGEGNERAILKEKKPLEKRGKLIGVEGPDGAGKTTVVKTLMRTLQARGYPCVVSNWNDTTEIYNIMMRLNASGKLTKEMRCIFGAVELAARFHYVLGPALSEGKTVFAVKYLVSALAHAVIRGHDLRFVGRLYDFAPRPELILYLDMDPEVALKRKLEEGHIGFWEAGLDLSVDAPLEEILQKYRTGALSQEFLARSFVAFQGGLRELHSQLLKDYEVVRLDGHGPSETIALLAERAVDELMAG